MARKHCSYCHQRGHTRPTCSVLRKEIRDHPEGGLARIEARKKSTREARGGNVRRCSYCDKSGHNKATCTKLKFDRHHFAAKNRKFNNAFVEKCAEIGFGPGALIELASSADFESQSNYQIQNLERERKHYGSLGMIVGFWEKNLNSDLANLDKYMGSTQGVVRVRFPNGRSTILPLPREFRHVASNSEECKIGYWKLGCPVKIDKKRFLRGFSAEWRDGVFSVDRQVGIDKS